MMNIGSLIDIYRMTELKPETRSAIIIKLGKAFNDTMGMNITQPIVYELVELLEPTNEILKDLWFCNAAGKELPTIKEN